jgi:GAF domain-containing protein
MRYIPLVSDLRRSSVHSAARDAHTVYDDAPPPLDFLEDVSRQLAHSFLQSTLATAAELALPMLGTWCMVDVVESNHSIRRLSIIHPDADRQDRARAHYEAHPHEANEPIGAARLLIAGSETIVVLSEDALETHAPRGKAELLRDLGAKSLIIVGMRIGERTLGAITFGSATQRQYDTADILLAEELGRRCALTVDGARSYAAMQMARVRAEHTFAMQDAARAEVAFAANRRACEPYRLDGR